MPRLRAIPTSMEWLKLRRALNGWRRAMDQGRKVVKDASAMAMPSRDLLFVSAVFLYFTGFWYISCFYEEFGLTASLSDVPVYYYFVYCYRILIGLRGTQLAMVATALLASLLALQVRGLARPWATSAAGLLLFISLGRTAESMARDHARAIREGFGVQPVEFTFAVPAESGLSEPLRTRNAAGDLMLLNVGRDAYLAFFQDGPEDGAWPKAQVFLIPRTSVTSVRVLARDFSTRPQQESTQ